MNYPWYLENRRWTQPKRLNCRKVLFGGALLEWLDEDCTMLCQQCVKSSAVVFTTVAFDRVSFIKPAFIADRLLFQYEVVHIGKTTITARALVKTLKDNGPDELIFHGFNTHVALACPGYNPDDDVSPLEGQTDPVEVRQHLRDEIIEQIDNLKASKYWEFVAKLRGERKADPVVCSYVNPLTVPPYIQDSKPLTPAFWKELIKKEPHLTVPVSVEE